MCSTEIRRNRAELLYIYIYIYIHIYIYIYIYFFFSRSAVRGKSFLNKGDVKGNRRR